MAHAVFQGRYMRPKVTHKLVKITLVYGEQQGGIYACKIFWITRVSNGFIGAANVNICLKSILNHCWKVIAVTDNGPHVSLLVDQDPGQDSDIRTGDICMNIVWHIKPFRGKASDLIMDVVLGAVV